MPSRQQFSSMWARILEEFSDSPAQTQVVRYLLENGFGVNTAGRVICNDVEIPATHLAKVIGIDRRVVDATAKHILNLPHIAEIFLNLRVTPDLSGLVEHLGLSMIVLYPKDATEGGIVGSAVRVLTDHDVTIRQIFVTDPVLSEDPRLVIITEGPIPAVVYEEMRGLPQTRRLII